MNSALSRLRTVFAPISAWLPSTIDRRVRVMAWLSLIAQILIVGTGGAVRLTGSGLGCPTWPRCTADSFVSTPEQGLHGVIEFGNRLLTFVLILIALAMFLFVVRMRKERPELFRLALVIGLGIPFQGVIGGITVLMNLNPYIVGLHFVLSTVLVVLATVLVYRVYRGRRGVALVAPRWYVATGHLASFFVGVTIVVGILTTGSGPHAGDKGSARNGLDSELLQHLHSYPAYITLGLTIVLLVGAVRMRLPAVAKAVVLMLGVELAQILVGISQSRLGLPELLVGIHMVLACVLAAAMTVIILNLRERSVTVSLPRAPQSVGAAAV